MADTKLQAELDALQLEELRYRVQEMRGNQQGRETRRRSVQEALEAERRNTALTQASCFHKKGGLGVESLMQGNDQHYAVAKFILPTGPQIVICMRCFKLWSPPELPYKATPEDKQLYARQVKEYQDACAFPTDNTTGGSQIYLVRDNRDRIAA